MDSKKECMGQSIMFKKNREDTDKDNIFKFVDDIRQISNLCSTELKEPWQKDTWILLFLKCNAKDAEHLSGKEKSFKTVNYASEPWFVLNLYHWEIKNVLTYLHICYNWSFIW